MSFKQTNYKKPIKSEGWCFCCDWYLAGLDGGIEEAFDYAVSQNWVRKRDCYVLDHNALINGLKSKYGTSGRNGTRVRIGNHFVVQVNGKTVYNPA